MGDERESRSETPLEPVYAFGEPGGTILVYEGDIDGVYPGTRQGRIELALDPKPSLNWSIEREPADFMQGFHDFALEIERRGRTWSIEASPKDGESGWINNCALGSSDTKLSRILIH